MESSAAASGPATWVVTAAASLLIRTNCICRGVGPSPVEEFWGLMNDDFLCRMLLQLLNPAVSKQLLYTESIVFITTVGSDAYA